MGHTAVAEEVDPFAFCLGCLVVVLVVMALVVNEAGFFVQAAGTPALLGALWAIAGAAL
jgi:hypothetical protein